MVEVKEYITVNTCGIGPKVQNGNFLKIVRKPPKRSFIMQENSKKKENRLKRLYGHFPCDHFEPL